MKNTVKTFVRFSRGGASIIRNRKTIAICILALFTIPFFVCSQTPNPKPEITNSQVLIFLSCGQNCLWSYRTADSKIAYQFTPPSFEIDGKQISAEVHHFFSSATPVHLANGVTQYSFEGQLAQDGHLHLGIEFQINEGTPVIRFRYTLTSDQPKSLTAKSGVNHLTYLRTSLKQFPQAEEVRLSNFAELTHSYELSEEKIADRNFADSGAVMGPILAATGGGSSFLLAYEHGSTVPDAFLEYRLTPSRNVSLDAVKGNYYPGQIIDADHPYKTIWFETAAQLGNLISLPPLTENLCSGI